jgi:protein-tyrosine phosphatase
MQLRPWLSALAGHSVRRAAASGAGMPFAENPGSGKGCCRMGTDSYDRVIRLAGGGNFRDIGGYETASGRRVKWRTIFRSGSLVGLTRADWLRLAEMQIATIYDLRSSNERSIEPCPIHHVPGLAYYSREYVVDNNAMLEWLSKTSVSANDVRSAMLDFYRALPWRLSEHYREIFALVARLNVPLVFNCAAGKDRTGVMAALLLSVLGVEEEDIIDDYSLSDKLVDYEKEATSPELSKRAVASGFAFVSAMSKETRAPLMKSDPDYIRAALDAIRLRCGSLQDFVKNELCASDESLDRIRSRLLD